MFLPLAVKGGVGYSQGHQIICTYCIAVGLKPVPPPLPPPPPSSNIPPHSEGVAYNAHGDAFAFRARRIIPWQGGGLLIRVPTGMILIWTTG